MAARILGNTTAASGASVKLRAGVASVIVGLTRVYPVSDVAYILMVVGAYLDTTGRFKYTTDIFSVVDATSFSTSKVADADSFTLSDSPALDISKPLTDTTSLSDSVLTVLIFIRDFADTASPTDANTLLISPAYSDSLFLSDSGTVTSQNYCNITYFLTDYVGEFRTF